MSNYKKLKEAFQKEKKTLYNKLRHYEKNIAKLKRIRSIINSLLNENIDDHDFNDEELLRLRKYFPNLDEIYELYIKTNNYHQLIRFNRFSEIDIDVFIKDIERCNRLYGIPPLYAVEDIKKTAEIIKKIKQGNLTGISQDDMEIFLGRDEETTSHVLYSSSGALRDMLYLELLRSIVRELDKEKEKDLSGEVDGFVARISLIDKYNKMFSDDELLIKFVSVDELKTFTDLIESLLSDDECIEILYNVQVDQKKEKKEIIIVNFDNLDLTKFTLEEQNIIKELQEIIEEENIKETDNIFSDIKVSYNSRETAYQNASMNNILLDVYCLLNSIYDKKEEIIKIFKLIILLYRKHTIRKIREERELDLLRIRDDLVNILTFINRTYIDRDSAYEHEKTILNDIETINKEYLPLIRELIASEEVEDEFYDDEIDKVITKYKNIIKKWKKEMTSYYQEDTSELDIKEDTDNLVFCLTQDIDLSREGFSKEFLGTVEELESKSPIELKKRPGRKGMCKFHKMIESNKEKDFVEYLENKFKIKLHFVPYRYSSDSNCRTGVIKFNPSTPVKKFLEERYGLCKQSAYYGIFKIISVVRADHSEYSLFYEYMMNNLLEIEELAKLFASENPDFDKLTSMIDVMLGYKKEKIEKANDNSKQKK